MKTRIHSPKRPRSGFTLVELLVVVAMMVILIGVLTAAMQPVLAGKEIREAARGLNAYIAGTVARAAELGRPVGIWIQRSSANPNSSFDIFYAEQPPLYGGDTITARAAFTGPNSVDLSQSALATVPGVINIGDRIRFNYAGPWYEINGVTPGTPSVTFLMGAKPAPPYALNDAVPFQIQRAPRKSIVQPMQLPANTVIDLSVSGVGSDTRFADPTNMHFEPVVIMFAPNATIDRVYYHDGTTYGARSVLGSIHLMIGRPDQVGQSPGNLGAAPNDNRWISINYQTGRVITTENMGGAITNARRFATSGQGMGGG